MNANSLINTNTVVHVLKPLWVIFSLNSSNFLGKTFSRTADWKYCFRVVYFWMQGFISVPKANNTFFAVALLFLLLCWISLRLTLNFLLQCAAKFLMKMPSYFTFMLGKKDCKNTELRRYENVSNFITKLGGISSHKTPGSRLYLSIYGYSQC